MTAAAPRPLSPEPGPSILEQIKRDIRNDHFQQKCANDGQRFVAWYVHNIHGRDVIETREDAMDGQGDQQIDAIVVDDDSTTIHIIQGKFLGSAFVDAAPLREVLSSCGIAAICTKFDIVGDRRIIA